MTWGIHTPGDEETNALAESRTHIDLQENIFTRLNWLFNVAQGSQLVQSVEEVFEQFQAVIEETRQLYAQAGAYQDGILTMKEQRDMAILDAHEAKIKGVSLAKKDFAADLAARYGLSVIGAQRIIDYLFADSDYIPSQYTIRDLDLVIEALDRDLMEDAMALAEAEEYLDAEWEELPWNE
jgi:hypothetical protein